MPAWSAAAISSGARKRRRAAAAAGSEHAVPPRSSRSSTPAPAPHLRRHRHLASLPLAGRHLCQGFEGRALEDSKWRLELPASLRQFDYETVTDVILTIRYTAREGGAPLASAIQEPLREGLQSMTRLEAPNLAGQVRLFSARAEFPEAWRSFVATGESGPTVLDLDLDEQRFPHPIPTLGMRKIQGVILFARWAPDDAVVPVTTNVFEDSTLEGPDAASGNFTFTRYKQDEPPPDDDKAHYVWVATPSIGTNKSLGAWHLEVPGWSGEHAPEDILIAVAYRVNEI